VANVHRAQVTRLPPEKLSNVDQLEGNVDHEGVGDFGVQIVLFEQARQDAERPEGH